MSVAPEADRQTVPVVVQRPTSTVGTLHSVSRRFRVSGFRHAKQPWSRNKSGEKDEDEDFDTMSKSILTVVAAYKACLNTMTASAQVVDSRCGQECIAIAARRIDWLKKDAVESHERVMKSSADVLALGLSVALDDLELALTLRGIENRLRRMRAEVLSALSKNPSLANEPMQGSTTTYEERAKSCLREAYDDVFDAVMAFERPLEQAIEKDKAGREAARRQSQATPSDAN